MQSVLKGNQRAKSRWTSLSNFPGRTSLSLSRPSQPRASVPMRAPNGHPVGGLQAAPLLSAGEREYSLYAAETNKLEPSQNKDANDFGDN